MEAHPEIREQYLALIKRPMDLAKIRTKLSARKYPDASSFEADVNLVFDNACKFNCDDTEVGCPIVLPAPATVLSRALMRRACGVSCRVVSCRVMSSCQLSITIRLGAEHLKEYVRHLCSENLEPPGSVQRLEAKRERTVGCSIPLFLVPTSRAQCGG